MIGDWWRTAIARIAGFLRLGRSDADVADEIATHLTMHAADLEKAGLDPAAARRAAQVAFGSVGAAREAYRDRRSLPLFEALIQDLQCGGRVLTKRRSSSAIAVLTLAIGVAATTATFSVVNSVLLKPPHPDSENIVWLTSKPARGGSSSVSTLDFLDWKDKNSAFDRLAAWQTGSMSLIAGATPRELRTLLTTSDYFDIFHLTTELGRGLQPPDTEPGQDHVVVISHELWVSEFAADSSVIGRVVRLQGAPYTVVGVMADGADAEWNWTEAWCPLAFYPENLTRAYYWLGIYGRLKPGIELEQARADMARVSADLGREYPETNKDRGVQVVAFHDLFLNPRLRESLLVLFGAAAAVLLIGSVNLATLMLARSIARRREITIRAALGGGRARIIRQLVAEHVLIAGYGCVAGLGLAATVMAVLRRLLPAFSSPGSNVPPRTVVTMDARVLLFALAASAASVLLFGVAPSLAAVRRSITSSLSGAVGREVPGTSARQRFRYALIVAEVAITSTLLTTTGVLIRSFLNLQRADTGFQSGNVVAATLPISTARARETPAERGAFYREILERVSTVPGVKAAALTSVLPMQGPGSVVPFQRVDEPLLDLASRATCFFKMVTPSYFGTIGLGVVDGRLFDDGADAPHEAVINASLVRYFRGVNPIGQHLLVPAVVQTGRARLGPDTSWTVVGVVANEQIGGLGARLGVAGVYVNLEQSPTRHPSILLRTEAGADVQRDVRLAVSSVDRDQSVDDIRTLDAMKAGSIAGERTRVQLLGVFAAAALLLSVVGVYSVMAHAVEQQMREFSLRVALGAHARVLMWRAVARGLFAAAAGGLIGLAAEYGVRRELSSALVGVHAFDPMTLAAVGLVMGAMTSVTAIVAARRVGDVDPVRLVRGD